MKLAVPPLLSDSLGVPPSTVTASLMLTVSVMTWPAFKFPLPLPSMPEPEVTTDVTVGTVVLICGVPARLVTAPEKALQLTSVVKADPATASTNGLVVSAPATITSTILAGCGPAGICGYPDDPTTGTL